MAYMSEIDMTIFVQGVQRPIGDCSVYSHVLDDNKGMNILQWLYIAVHYPDNDAL